MPAVQTPFLIAAIRERETGFLQEDEFTRLIEAESPQQALDVLVSTSYGEWLHVHPSASEVLYALTQYLVATQNWLAEHIDNKELVQFMTARYNGLNLATAVIEKRNKQVEPGPLSPLGSIDHSVIHSVIWNNLGWEYVPENWHEFLQHELELAKKGTNEPGWQAGVLLRAQATTTKALHELAFTPLTHALATLYEDENNVSAILRDSTTLAKEGLPTVWKTLSAKDSSAEVGKKLSFMGYRHFTEEAIEGVRSGTNAALYDKAWDEERFDRIKSHRFESIGYDAILAYWSAKELEAKSVRLLLMAKLNKSSIDTLYSLQRPIYV